MPGDPAQRVGHISGALSAIIVTVPGMRAFRVDVRSAGHPFAPCHGAVTIDPIS